MPQDLLTLADYEPPMGDLFTNHRLDAGRAVWTKPLPGERDVPKKRIIHQRVVRLHGPARLLRLGCAAARATTNAAAARIPTE